MPFKRDKKLKSLPAIDASSDAKTEFFMAASHQLKSPLAIIQWCVQSALEDKTLSPATRSLLSRAVGQSNGMSALLGDMLSTFRLIHGEKVAKPLVPVDASAVLDGVFEQYRPIAAAAEVRLAKGAVERLPFVLADEQYLKQAFINLIDNAIKYTPPRGRVEVSAAHKKGFAEISVSDTGIGIADVDQGRLFTEFFRTEAAKEKAREGTGLGLVLVKHIAESFGGEVSFTSRLGKGTTFTFRIPVAGK